MTRKTFGKKSPNLPFHPAVRAGDFIFISGQVPKDAEGNLFSGTIEAVRRALKEAGADLEDVVKATVSGGRARRDQHQDRNRRNRL